MNYCEYKKPKLTGIIIKRPLIASITTDNELKGKMNIGMRVVKEIVSFEPYVENQVLNFKTQAVVQESELIISG